MSFILGVVAPKPYIPHQNSRTKTLGCQLARKWFLSPETVLFELHVGNKHPTQNTASRGNFFAACKTPTEKFGNYSQLWQKYGLNRYRISVWKATLYWWQKIKHILVSFCITHGFPHCCTSTHCGPTLIFQVSSKFVQVWGSYNRKTLLQPPKWAYKNVIHSARVK